MRTPVHVVAFIVVLAVGLVASPGIPPQHWPFAPLDLEQPIGLATSLKLAGLRTRPEQCRAVLERSALDVSPIADHSEGDFCGFHNAVAIGKSTVR